MRELSHILEVHFENAIRNYRIRGNPSLSLLVLPCKGADDEDERQVAERYDDLQLLVILIGDR